MDPRIYILLEAASLGTLSVIEQLHREGFDLNSQHPVNKWTALHWAVKRNQKSSVQYLINLAKVDASICDSQSRRAIDLATDPEIVKLLNPEATVVAMDVKDNKFTPSYIKYPSATTDLINFSERNFFKRKKESSEPDIREQTFQPIRKELLIYAGEINDTCIKGILVVTDDINIGQLKEKICLELGITIDFDLYREVNLNRKLLTVPISKGQYSMKVSEYFPDNMHSVLIKHN